MQDGFGSHDANSLLIPSWLWIPGLNLCRLQWSVLHKHGLGGPIALAMRYLMAGRAGVLRVIDWAISLESKSSQKKGMPRRVT